MEGLDYADRLNPVWAVNESDYVSGRFLIPNASGSTTIEMSPIDTREISRLTIQWVAGNPADTTANIGGALSFYGSCLAADSPIGDATYLTSDTDISRLPIEFVDDYHGVLVDSTTAYFNKRVITSSTSGLQYVDTAGAAWVGLKLASKGVSSTTQNIFYYGKKDK
jgi:hypothetical protein